MKNTLNLKDYLWNVCEITINNDEAADKGVAFDMLRSNIREGREVYPGTDLDYPALKEQWDGMTGEEQAQSRKEYHMCDDFPVINKIDIFHFTLSLNVVLFYISTNCVRGIPNFDTYNIAVLLPKRQ